MSATLSKGWLRWKEKRLAYPKNWPAIAEACRARAGYCCQHCGARHRWFHPTTGSVVFLQAAHLDHDVSNCADENLRSLCPALPSDLRRGHSHATRLHDAPRGPRSRNVSGDTYSMTRAYEDFLAGKARLDPPTGIPGDLNLPGSLFPFQRDIVTWALRRGRAAIFAQTGLGKSFMELAWGNAVHQATNGNVLLLTPLAVAGQMVREAAKFGIPAKQCSTQDDVEPGITVTNYGKLHHFDLSEFSGVILDECFAAGTLIDTPGGKRQIEDLRIGDQILNASGVDTLSDVHRREVPYAVKVTHRAGSCIASPNHPFFTQRGWVGAKNLRPGDCALGTAEAVRLVRNGLCPEVPEPVRTAILRSILLSEMADESAGAPCESAQPRGSSEAWGEPICMAEVGGPESSGGTRTNPQAESDIRYGSSKEDIHPIETDGPSTFRAWGQWPWADGTAGIHDGCSWRRLDSGICFVTGPTRTGISDTLQNRLGEHGEADRHRGRWSVPLQPAASGREERCKTDFIGLEGIEILEPGHPELERLRDADGKLYFYDLGGTRHPSFSVNGALVHNSSILKSFDGKTRNLLIEQCAQVPYRLAATATPAPNDFNELGNHAEFLGVMSYTGMQSIFFTHDGGDTGTWRLKGHAEQDFWRWMCSWSVLLRKPSDLGYDDGAYDLPELIECEHIIPVEGPAAKTLGERLRARRASINERVAKAAELTPADGAFVWWCNLNDESAALAAAIPGAVEVCGSEKESVKEHKLNDFAAGKIRVLVTKCSIAGWGLNWQHCRGTGFVGLNDSFEQVYQAVRRFWRFGQTQTVTAHFIAASTEGAVLENLHRKEADADRMGAMMVANMSDLSSALVQGAARQEDPYEPDIPVLLPAWLQTEEC